MIYAELIKRLREASVYFGESDHISVMMIEAADAIEELQQITTHYEEESKGWWLAACDAKEERERLKEQIPKWIPVTERLPELHKIVLVVDKANDIGMGTLEPLWDGTVWVVPFEDVDNEFCPISHWMPLPQPPKEEK